MFHFNVCHANLIVFVAKRYAINTIKVMKNRVGSRKQVYSNLILQIVLVSTIHSWYRHLNWMLNDLI